MNEDFFARLVAQAFVIDDGEAPTFIESSFGLVASAARLGAGHYSITLRAPGAPTAFAGRGVVHVTPVSVTFIGATFTIVSATRIDIFLWDAAGGPADSPFCFSLWLQERFGGKTLPVTSP